MWLCCIWSHYTCSVYKYTQGIIHPGTFMKHYGVILWVCCIQTYYDYSVYKYTQGAIGITENCKEIQHCRGTIRYLIDGYNALQCFLMLLLAGSELLTPPFFLLHFYYIQTHRNYNRKGNIFLQNKVSFCMYDNKDN